MDMAVFESWFNFFGRKQNILAKYWNGWDGTNYAIELNENVQYANKKHVSVYYAF